MDVVVVVVVVGIVRAIRRNIQWSFVGCLFRALLMSVLLLCRNVCHHRRLSAVGHVSKCVASGMFTDARTVEQRLCLALLVLVCVMNLWFALGFVALTRKAKP